tara:strand:- start:396 stop:590 length:195 start_codon:yes stop_codon:yes gene_type:complete
MWSAKNKFGDIVRSKMNAKELEKFISKNKGYSYPKEIKRTNAEIIAYCCFVSAAIIQIIILWTR